tara:strand:- start:1664 stop:1984 length:321 start_codon:yes stop_codon:yes gene_type:complete
MYPFDARKFAEEAQKLHVSFIVNNLRNVEKIINEAKVIEKSNIRFVFDKLKKFEKKPRKILLLIFSGLVNEIRNGIIALIESISVIELNTIKIASNKNLIFSFLLK